LSRDWKEAQEKRISIPDTDPETLEAYLNWVYSRQVTLSKGQELCDNCSKAESTSDNCTVILTLELAKMHTLGDYLVDLQFCNAIADLLAPAVCKAVTVPRIEAVEWIWERTARDCPLRDYCLEMWKFVLSKEATHKQLENVLSKVPKAFVVDLLILVGDRHKAELKNDFTTQLKRLAEKCKMHKHVDDLDKCS
jgi:hypothetical protein